MPSLFRALAAATLASFVIAAPLEERQSTTASLPPNAQYSISSAQAEALITCPTGFTGAKNGVVFLVHGTGSTGKESWAAGPYVKFLPQYGFDVCYIDLPGRTLGDAQVTAEYVARGIKYLAGKSSTGKVSIVGHSQGGGINPQWALQFFPQDTRPYVTRYVALAGDFKGTVQAALLCNPLKAPTCLPSLWQQTVGSHYLAAQNSPVAGSGASALVPTTSIYTITDDIVGPELPRAIASSNLAGADVHALQDLNFCGPTHLADHFTMIVDPAAFGLVKQALLNPNAPVDMTKFDKAYCTYFKENVLFNGQDLATNVRSIVVDLLANTATLPKTFAEPPLKQYVCDRGFATNCSA